MGFSALRLPQVAFDNVYKFLNVPDIICLSQCSKRMKAVVKSQEGPRQGRQVAVDFYGDFVKIAVVKRVDASVTKYLFSWRIHQSGAILSDEVIKVDGIPWETSKITSGIDLEWWSVSKSGCFEKDLLSLIAMLRELFKCSIANITLYLNEVLTGDSFQKLFVETDALRRSDCISVDISCLEPIVVDFVFDHFITDNLTILGRFPKDYSYQNPLNFPSIFLSNATWVNLEQLLEMSKTSKKILLYEAELISDKDINQFLKNWLSSDNKTLKSVRLSRFQSSPFSLTEPQNEVAIMEGIAYTPGRKKREEDFELAYIKWQNGLDIIRKDGVHATIHVTQGKYSHQLVFFVWQSSNPNEVTDN